jgi:hypothetical protein
MLGSTDSLLRHVLPHSIMAGTGWNEHLQDELESNHLIANEKC